MPEVQRLLSAVLAELWVSGDHGSVVTVVEWIRQKMGFYESCPPQRSLSPFPLLFGNHLHLGSETLLRHLLPTSGELPFPSFLINSDSLSMS